jgi:steroid delta-isomerase-like uncharacterized protein
MPALDNKVIVRRWYVEALNMQNLAVADEIIADDFVINGEAVGRAGLKQAAMWVRSVFADIHVTIDEMLAEADKVVTRWTARGTHRGTFLGVPPTGKPVILHGIHIDRLAGGMIVERWENADIFGLLQQLGAIPPRGQGGH